MGGVDRDVAADKPFEPAPRASNCLLASGQSFTLDTGFIPRREPFHSEGRGAFVHVYIIPWRTSMGNAQQLEDSTSKSSWVMGSFRSQASLTWPQGRSLASRMQLCRSILFQTL